MRLEQIEFASCRFVPWICDADESRVAVLRVPGVAGDVFQAPTLARVAA